MFLSTTKRSSSVASLQKDVNSFLISPQNQNATNMTASYLAPIKMISTVIIISF